MNLDDIRNLAKKAATMSKAPEALTDRILTVTAKMYAQLFLALCTCSPAKKALGSCMRNGASVLAHGCLAITDFMDGVAEGQELANQITEDNKEELEDIQNELKKLHQEDEGPDAPPTT